MEKEFYTINDLAVISGFTTRSLRNFISRPEDFVKDSINGWYK